MDIDGIEKLMAEPSRFEGAPADTTATGQTP
jgi:hypothetical protein